MFFLLRSAACIGVVFCMLPESGGSAALHDLAADSGRLVVGGAQRYCTSNPDCLRAGTKLVAGAFSARFDQASTARPSTRFAAAASGKGRQPVD